MNQGLKELIAMQHMSHTIRDISKIIGAEILLLSNPEEQLKHLLLDSRKLVYPENSLFFAIGGNKLDGHDYINELYLKGVRSFIVSREIDVKPLLQANVLRVPNVITALQKIAQHHRQQFEYPVIGITGSNGKTIVKEWLYQMLNEDYQIVRSPKSYNSQLGVPLSVWQMGEQHNLAIFEAGISEPDEMDRLEKIIKPNIGIFTNIGEAHQAGFLNMAHKINEKLKLFVNSDILIYCKDYPDLNQNIAAVAARVNNGTGKEKFKTFSWSTGTEADLMVESILKKGSSSFVQCRFNNQNFELEIPFTDRASIENVLHCTALMLYLNFEPLKIQERIRHLQPIAMRLELKDGINGCSLINDTYNSDLNSLGIALDFLNQQNQQELKTVILSDILQSGKNDIELFTEVKERLLRAGISKFIGIGDTIQRCRKIFEHDDKMEFHTFASVVDFIRDFDINSFKNEVILIKGARKFRFEKISKLLEKKAHETVLEINLGAIVNNLKVYQSLLKPDTKTMAMVKAFSYGSGSFEIANVLQFHRVDYLAVAYADEGVDLRKNGISLPIMVMNPEVSAFETMIQNNLEPEMYSLKGLEQFMNTLRIMKDNSDPMYPIHIELETGMHRLGFEEADLEDLIAKIRNNKLVKVASVFSHLVGSDEFQHDEFTQLQLQRFDRMSARIMRDLGYPVLKHMLNSAGIVRFPEAQYEMVRLGLGLYGIDLTNTVQHRLQNVSTLKTIISQIKMVGKDETIGYNRIGKTDRDSRVATVAIGYADGLSRRLSNGRGRLWVNGHLAPIIGNICMDMTMIDVTAIDCEEGDEVVIFGEELPITEISKDIDTIPYELLSCIPQRVKRVYFQE